MSTSEESSELNELTELLDRMNAPTGKRMPRGLAEVSGRLANLVEHKFGDGHRLLVQWNAIEGARRNGGLSPAQYYAEVTALARSAHHAELTRAATDTDVKRSQKGADGRTVFVVHGRDLKIRDALFAFLRSIGLKPLEWEQAILQTGTPAPYVGEVLDIAFTRAQAVVVLFTPDETVTLRQELVLEDDPPHERSGRGQSRANVLFEAGMALGRSPQRTVLVQAGQVHVFSDIRGRHIARFSDQPGDRHALANSLAAAGCAVDLTGQDWLKDIGTDDGR